MTDTTEALLEKIRSLGGTPITITPYDMASTRINMLDGSMDNVLQTLEILNGEALTSPERAMAEVAVLQEKERAEPSLRSLKERLDTATATIASLVMLYRTVYQPLREGSLVRPILLSIDPRLRESKLHISEIAPLDAPLNPWFLLREGDEHGAVSQLCQELGWPEQYRPQALTLLKEFA